jgi:uncharacterized protein involved in propanediol utilization
LHKQVVHQTGHFGEWLQGRMGPNGPVALVTLPFPCPVLQAWHFARSGPLRVQGAGLSTGQARRFLRDLGVDMPGRVRLRPLVPPGQGMGLSTARLVALARLAGFAGPDTALARACLRAEGASDPLWRPAPARALWASRQGRALADMPALPRYQIIGGLWGLGQRTDPQDTRFPDISDLVTAWQRARSLAEFAALASESAARCVAMRGPVGDPTARLGQELGALGWVAAHTGSARGLVFAPGTAPNDTAARLRAAGHRHVTTFQGGVR